MSRNVIKFLNILDLKSLWSIFSTRAFLAISCLCIVWKAFLVTKLKNNDPYVSPYMKILQLYPRPVKFEFLINQIFFFKCLHMYLPQSPKSFHCEMSWNWYRHYFEFMVLRAYYHDLKTLDNYENGWHLCWCAHHWKWQIYSFYCPK